MHGWRSPLACNIRYQPTSHKITKPTLLGPFSIWGKATSCERFLVAKLMLVVDKSQENLSCVSCEWHNMQVG